MLLTKPPISLNYDLLWQNQNSNGELSVFETTDQTVLQFGVFYVDKFMEANREHMRGILQKLDSHLRDWNIHYPWSDFNGIDLRLNRMKDNSYIIRGQLTVEGHVKEEESLVVALLQSFSDSIGSRVFIRVCDSDGDFILMECNNILPKEYEYPSANNRLWLHEGKFKMIPQDFQPNRGLRPAEALRFLRNDYFKLIEVNDLTTAIARKMIKGYPEKYLSNLKRLPLIVEDEKSAVIFNANPQVVSFLIRNLAREDVTVEKEIAKGDLHSLELIVPQRHCEFLSLFLQANDLLEDSGLLPLYCGRALCKVLRILLESQTLFLKENERPKRSDSEETFFKNELAAFKPNFQEQPEKDANPEVSILEQIGKTINDDLQKNASNDQKRKETDSDKEGDDLSRRYFESEKVDIDEDDFFEFFLKEALKIKEENIDSLRGVSFENSDQRYSSSSEQEREDSDTEIENDECNNFTQDNLCDEHSMKALHELFASMQMEGATDVHMQNMLRTLGHNK